MYIAPVLVVAILQHRQRLEQRPQVAWPAQLVVGAHPPEEKARLRAEEAPELIAQFGLRALHIFEDDSHSPGGLRLVDRNALDAAHLAKQAATQPDSLLQRIPREQVGLHPLLDEHAHDAIAIRVALV